MHSFIRHSSDTNNGMHSSHICNFTSGICVSKIRPKQVLQQNLDIALVHDSNLFMTRSCAPQELPRVLGRKEAGFMTYISVFKFNADR